MNTENELTEAQDKISSIGKKIILARGAHADLMRYLREASELADKVSFPCADKVAEYLDDAIFHAESVESPIDDAETQNDALFHLFYVGEAEAILDRCRGCIHRCSGGCFVRDDATELEHPCPEFEPEPEGFNCYQCTRFSRGHGVCSVTGEEIACPGEHCCASFERSDPPEADPNQPLLAL